MGLTFKHKVNVFICSQSIKSKTGDFVPELSRPRTMLNRQIWYQIPMIDDLASLRFDSDAFYCWLPAFNKSE